MMLRSHALVLAGALARRSRALAPAPARPLCSSPARAMAASFQQPGAYDQPGYGGPRGYGGQAFPPANQGWPPAQPEHMGGAPMQGAPIQDYGGMEPPPEIDWNKDLANNVSLIGNLASDPYYKVLASGKAVANVDIAVSRGRRADNLGTDWIGLDFWEDDAEMARTFLTKGQSVCVQGRLRIDQWQDKTTGAKNSKVKLTVNSLQRVRSGNFAGSMGGGGYDQPATPYSAAPGAYSPSQTPPYQDAFAAAPRDGAYNVPPSNAYAAPPTPQYNQPPSAAFASAPAAPAAAASPKGSEKEQLWNLYFEDPNAWFDNRNSKRNPRAPDFKQKNGEVALWLNSYDTPAWVHERLSGPDAASQGDYYNESPGFTSTGEALPEEPPF